jgi:topoisomerase IV subunit A
MRLKDARLADLRTLDLPQGLSWRANGKERRVADLAGWLGARASSGRMVPHGFPRDNRFS